jgi:hypothetical protein
MSSNTCSSAPSAWLVRAFSPSTVGTTVVIVPTVSLARDHEHEIANLASRGRFAHDKFAYVGAADEATKDQIVTRIEGLIGDESRLPASSRLEQRAGSLKRPPRIPSLALRLAHVAQGKAEAALAFSYKHDWDLAAGDLIVNEAGGKMSDLDGQGLRYDFARTQRLGFICANPSIHAALLAHGPIAAGQ